MQVELSSSSTLKGCHVRSTRITPTSPYGTTSIVHGAQVSAGPSLVKTWTMMIECNRLEAIASMYDDQSRTLGRRLAAFNIICYPSVPPNSWIPCPPPSCQQHTCITLGECLAGGEHGKTRVSSHRHARHGLSKEEENHISKAFAAHER